VVFSVAPDDVLVHAAAANHPGAAANHLQLQELTHFAGLRRLAAAAACCTSIPVYAPQVMLSTITIEVNSRLP
jgi:hypothetical protein